MGACYKYPSSCLKYLFAKGDKDIQLEDDQTKHASLKDE